jgi:anaerobic sulfite reductase subunit B
VSGTARAGTVRAGTAGAGTARGALRPLAYRVVGRTTHTADTVTLTLRARDEAMSAWAPGQFTMVYAFGVGEVPLSVSGGGASDGEGDGQGVGLVRHTVRAVGAVTRAISAAPVGSVLGVRGPFGRGWPAPVAGDDVVVVAGGIGLAPLRPVVTEALAAGRGGRLRVVVGSRTPDDLLYTEQYPAWRAAGAEVLVTVDRADAGWTGHVGVVTTLLDAVPLGAGTVCYVCGPEMMMRIVGRVLVAGGVPAERVFVSVERNMRCGEATCGHCQLGPLLLCRDGPVVSFPVAEPLFLTRQL